MPSLNHMIIEKLFQEVDELKNEEGYMLFKVISELRLSLYIFNHNLFAYQKSIDGFYAIENIFFNGNLKRWHLQKGMLSHLHNTVTSIISYYDHVEKNIRQLKINDDWLILWEKYVKEHRFHFVRLIRDYSIHFGIIPLNQSVTIIQNSEKVFDRKELINKNKFIDYLDASSRGNKNKYSSIKYYLQSLPNKIDILTILQELREEVKIFHRSLIFKSATINDEILTSFIQKVEKQKQSSKEYGIRTDLVLSDSQLRLLKFILKRKN